MNQILIFILEMIVGGIIVWLFVRKTHKFITPRNTHPNKLDPSSRTSSLRGEGMLGMTSRVEMPALIERQAKEKEKNKQIILEAFERAQRITNDDIQKLLGVSDATATRYLEELEKEGKIRQIGITGKGVYYEKI